MSRKLAEKATDLSGDGEGAAAELKFFHSSGGVAAGRHRSSDRYGLQKYIALPTDSGNMFLNPDRAVLVGASMSSLETVRGSVFAVPATTSRRASASKTVDAGTLYDVLNVLQGKESIRSFRKTHPKAKVEEITKILRNEKKRKAAIISIEKELTSSSFRTGDTLVLPRDAPNRRVYLRPEEVSSTRGKVNINFNATSSALNRYIACLETSGQRSAEFTDRYDNTVTGSSCPVVHLTFDYPGPGESDGPGYSVDQRERKYFHCAKIQNLTARPWYAFRVYGKEVRENTKTITNLVAALRAGANVPGIPVNVDGNLEARRTAIIERAYTEIISVRDKSNSLRFSPEKDNKGPHKITHKEIHIYVFYKREKTGTTWQVSVWSKLDLRKKGDDVIIAEEQYPEDTLPTYGCAQVTEKSSIASVVWSLAFKDYLGELTAAVAQQAGAGNPQVG